jgi:hypothetical protein
MEKPIERKRAKKMLPTIKILISSRAIQESEKKRGILANELIRDIKRNFPKEKTPAKDTIVKLISRARNSNRDEDKPWHLCTFEDNPISSKTIAQIFELKTEGLKTISVSDSQWLDRLSSLQLHIWSLLYFAQRLSLSEKLSQISRSAPDVSDLEEEILNLLRMNPQNQMAHGVWVRSNEREGLDVIAIDREIRENLKHLNKEDSNERTHS